MENIALPLDKAVPSVLPAEVAIAMNRLVKAVQAMSMARSLEDITTIVRKAARELSGADGATFVLRDGDMCWYVDEDAIGPLWKGRRFPMNICISGWAMTHRTLVVIPDIYVDDRVPVEAYKPTFVRSLAMIPIRTAAPIGAIGLYWAQPFDPPKQSLEWVQALADTASVALENVRVYSELERLVEDRTRELQQLNSDLESFSYSVSHDLRAPLRAMDGFSAILKEEHAGALPADGHKLLDHIGSSAKQMSRLIEDLLLFSRTSRKNIEKVRLDLTPLARSVSDELLALEPQDRKIDFHLQRLGLGNVDLTATRQIFVNLMSNALKFSRNKPETKIEIGSVINGAETIYFVRDNGAGFDPVYAGKLFKVFQRLHRADEFEGVGVGLAIVHRIVQKHGGRVWAETSSEGGACFYFTLADPPTRSFPVAAPVTAA